MSESPENEMELLPQVSVKPILPSIPTDEKELRELKEDLRAMGCGKLLLLPWNLESEDTLREFLFQRGNQWDKTERRDPENWTPETWCEVYEFRTGIKEGWAGRKDGLFAGKFSGSVDPKEGLHPNKCKSLRDRRMLEFMMPILNPEKPKRVTLTVANTLFGALSGVRPVNWGIIIHDIVEKGIQQIGQRTSYLTPFILHLYACFGCTTVDEDDKLIAGEEEIRFRIQPRPTDDGEEGNQPDPEAGPSQPASPPESSRRAGTPPPPSPRRQSAPSPQRPPPSPHGAGPSRKQPEAPWQNVDLSTWTFPESPFQRVYADMENLQLQYNRLEHITRGVNDALHDCGPGNILRELAKRADRKELDQARKEHDQTKEELERVRSANTHLNAQVSAMTQELNRKTDEIRKHHAEQTVVFQRIRELVGQPAEAVVKARLFDELLKKAEPYEARKTLPILVKYTRLMNGLFEDVQRLIPPGGTPRRVLYQGPPGSPSGTLYEAVGEVEVVRSPPTTVDPGEGSRPGSTGKEPEKTRSTQPRRKTPGSERSGRGQSPARRSPNRSRTPERSRTPVRRLSPARETASGKGKARAHQSSPSECMMMDADPGASKAFSIRDPELPARSEVPEPPTRGHLAQTPTSRLTPAAQTPVNRTPRAEGSGDSEEEIEIDPSPNVRRALTRLQHVGSPGTSVLSSGLDASYKEKATPKKHRSS